MVVRSQGGDNAGHTVVVDGETFKFRLIPSGILSPTTTCVIGHGMVVNPKSFLAELDELHVHGVSTGNLVISDRAHMVMPYHPVFDQLGEHQRGDDRLGTTHRGIGPAYEDKVRRVGFRVGDLSKPAFLEKKLRFVLRLKNESLTRLYGHEPFDERAILDEYLGYAERLEPYVRDIYPIIQGALRDGRRILCEGAQGAMLDLDLGTYPYVTSSAPTAGGALTGSGIPPSKVTRTIGVFKAYTTRVGYGPFPTELEGTLGELIREVGREFGTVTGTGAPRGLVRRRRGALCGEHQRHRLDGDHQGGRPRPGRHPQDRHRLPEQGRGVGPPDVQHLPPQARRARL